MYESGSLPAQFKPNQQGPKALPQSAFGRVIAPTKNYIYDRPSWIFMNNAGTYSFLYATTGSVGGYTADESFVTGSVVDTDKGSPARLDIQPVAWAGDTAGKTGDVTFVYMGGL